MRRILVLAATLIAAWASISQAGLITQSGARHYAAAAGGGDNTPFASQYSLEIIYPKASGAVPNGLDSNNRAFFAYTGLTYEIPLGAVGGSYPYTWQVSGGEAGKFSVASYTPASGFGTAYKLVYTDPQTTDDTTDITVTVTDAASATDSETYSITVGTTGWFFVDGTNDGSGDTGTISAPFDSLAQLYAASGAALANGRVYFHEGTYTPAGITVTNQDHALCEERIEWNAAGVPVVWLAYPGATPTIDFEYTGTSHLNCATGVAGDSVPRIRMTGSNIYIAGLEMTRDMTQAFQFSRTNRRGVTVWNNSFTVGGVYYPSGNSAFLMWITLDGTGTPNLQAYGDFLVSNTFSSARTGSAHGATIMYAMLKPLIEGNYCPQLAGDSAACITPKATMSQYTIRGNRGENITAQFITGNMAGDTAVADSPIDITYGDIAFNYCASVGAGVDASCLDIGNQKIEPDPPTNDDYYIGRTDVSRNTLNGRIRIQRLRTWDGPYTLSKNAIQNSDGAQTPWNFVEDADIGDSSRASVTDNLTGASGVFDASGNLIDTSKVGDYGHVIP